VPRKLETGHSAATLDAGILKNQSDHDIRCELILCIGGVDDKRKFGRHLQQL
jgi:hypothetical protein